MRYSEHVEKWKECRACVLHKCRYKIVFARGEVPSDITFIGEGPGNSENLTGKPFYGPAGAVLDLIIKNSIDEENEFRISKGKRILRYSIANLICCLPKEDGITVTDPPEYAVEACRPRLLEFLSIAKPKLIVLLGASPKKGLLPEHLEQIDLYPKMIELPHPASMLKGRMHPGQQGIKVQECVVTLNDELEDL